ncbi:hypothetical protein QJS10_CPB12g01175 [Acorus calamus]|uniref:AB hydrolase-1 domain-containing protein n=1 Tax=Acorus calamus TaxID=4465 RepID=A0AAV9DP60_ACOCL|nr:hypothetical protein QJS10_CPB12g01175 [Acorus calamus]
MFGLPTIWGGQPRERERERRGESDTARGGLTSFPSSLPSSSLRSDPMSKCFSFTSFRDRLYRLTFTNAGLRQATTVLHGGSTTVQWWVPRSPDPSKQSLLLLHGFGANATWQWSDHLRPLLGRFNVYVPDLLFFGGSSTSYTDRSESFQAECVAASMDRLGISRPASLVGISYGGFVGYRLAAAHPDAIDRVVLCCAGVSVDQADLGKEGLFVVSDVEEAGEILVPQTPDRLRQLMRLSFVRPPAAVPSCFLSDFIDVMCTEYVEEKKGLIRELIRDRKFSELPKITQVLPLRGVRSVEKKSIGTSYVKIFYSMQKTLIVWGEQDQIFPLELGHRLNRHLEENSRLVVIKNAGHAVNLEKPKEFCKHLKAFLANEPLKDHTNKAE